MIQERCLPVQPVETTNHIWRILAIVAIILIVGAAVSIGTWVNTYHNLRAAAQFDGNRFVIQNNDDFSWIETRLLLNTDYKFNTSTILPHSEFAVEPSQFVKDDGTKFDPASASPTDFYIVARISDSQWSSWFYKFP
jgi:hypothetical protein